MKDLIIGFAAGQVFTVIFLYQSFTRTHVKIPP